MLDLRLFLLAMLAALLAVCASCAKPTTTRSDPNDAYYDIGGFTVWSCNKPEPEFFISRRAHLDSLTHRAVWVHESSHRSLMLTFGCEQFREWRKSLDNRLLFEAVAYCAEMHQRVRDGVSPDVALKVASTQLTHRIYGFNLTREQAKAKLLGVCP